MPNPSPPGPAKSHADNLASPQDAPELAALLLCLDSRADGEILHSLTEWEMPRFEAACACLLQDGHMVRNAEGELCLLASPAMVQAAKDRLAAPDFRPNTESFFAYARLMQRNEELDALFCLHLFSQRLAEHAEEHAARLCYDLLLKRLLRLPILHAPQEDIRRYISLCIDAQALTFYFLHAVNAAIRMLFRARGIAHAIGDQRSIALINLVIGSVGSRPSDRHNSPRLHAIMRRGVQAINSLGDVDILDQASLYLGIYHFIEGHYSEALAYFAQAGQTATAWELRQDMLTIYTSTCYAYLGEFDSARSIVSEGWRNAQLSGYTLAARAIRTQLATLHILQDNLDEGLTHLDEVIGATQPSREPVTWVWSQQTLALYHFLRGNVAASHAVMQSCMRHSVERGSRRPIYLFPWLLELLSAYEEHGLPPIEGYAYEQELDHALHGPNRLMRAAGLRLSVRRELREGTPPNERMRRDLESALAISWEIQDRFEIIHSSIALAEYHLARNDRAAALRHAEEGWQVFQHYSRPGIPVWPKAVRALVANLPTPERQPQPERMYEHVRDTLAAMTETANIDEFHRNLLRTVCISLGGTRGALFRQEPVFSSQTAPAPVALFSLAGQVRHAALAAQSNAVQEAMLENHPSLRTKEQDGITQYSLSLPLPLGEGHGYGICLEGGFFRAISICLTPAFLTRLAAALEHECRLFHRYHSTVAAQKEEHLRALSPDADEALSAIQFRSAVMDHCLLRADLAAASDASVLILGESGVGKELLGRRIHVNSARPGPFVAVNLSSIPEELFESELFGHEKGAFTGALRQKQGLVELADRGTLFIDEIGDITPRVQVKLLRVLQERSFMRVGGTRLISSDFRLICATNRDMSEQVRLGNFRQDLYYRISVIPITLPPLRDREDDVIHLARYFLEHFSRKNKLPVPTLSAHDKKRLQAYPWPGNVRELRNVMERAVILNRSGQTHLSIDVHPAGTEATPPAQRSGLPTGLTENPAEGQIASQGSEAPAPFLPSGGMLPTLKEIQSMYIEYVLKQTDWKIDGPKGAAAILGLNRSSLYSRIKTLGLQRQG